MHVHHRHQSDQREQAQVQVFTSSVWRLSRTPNVAVPQFRCVWRHAKGGESQPRATVVCGCACACALLRKMPRGWSGSLRAPLPYPPTPSPPPHCSLSRALSLTRSAARSCVCTCARTSPRTPTHAHTRVHSAAHAREGCARACYNTYVRLGLLLGEFDGRGLRLRRVRE